MRDRAGAFDAVFQAECIRILASPPQAPRANAICERIIGTLRRELFDRLLQIAEDVAAELLALHVGELAGRAGPQWDGAPCVGARR